MKKKYVRPEFDIVELETCEMLLATSFGVSDTKGDHESDFVRGRRGAWGNLWKKE